MNGLVQLTPMLKSILRCYKGGLSHHHRHERQILLQLVSASCCRINDTVRYKSKSQHAFEQAGGIDHVMYPQYAHVSAADLLKQKAQESVVTIPLALRKRLEKRKVKEATKSAIKQRIIDASRKGTKARVLISCKNQEANHYYGQSYGKDEPIPLASKGWIHKEAAKAHDYFTIQPYDSNHALLAEENPLTFEDLGLSKSITDLLQTNNIKKPTTIQSYAIETLLKGEHCILASETGSGKTLAYLLPIFESLLRRKKARLPRADDKPLALILVPTRELVEQVFGVTNLYAKELGLNVKFLQGGNVGSKIGNPRIRGAKIDIMVSTVNIIKELSKAGVYELDMVETIVLDEADTLLDDSFSPDVLSLLQRFSFVGDSDGTGRTNLILVSATMPRSIDTILDGVFPAQLFEKITTPGLNRVMPHVRQKFLRLRKSEKSEKVIEIAKDAQNKSQPLIIFCNKSSTCTWLAAHLYKNDIPCIGLSAELSLPERAGRIDKFKTGETNVLVCTDLASRGIDTVNAEHVLNYDFPHYFSDYIHRCGRTGRVGGPKNSLVTNFVARIFEVSLVQEIESSVRKQSPIVNVNANIKRLLNVRLGGWNSEM